MNIKKRIKHSTLYLGHHMITFSPLIKRACNEFFLANELSTEKYVNVVMFKTAYFQAYFEASSLHDVSFLRRDEVTLPNYFIRIGMFENLPFLRKNVLVFYLQTLIIMPCFRLDFIRLIWQFNDKISVGSVLHYRV